MSNDFLEKQLSHKKRSLCDLARFVKTKAGKSANFTLLFGAGCSVSSGVRPATQLTEEWVKEVYASLNPEGKEPDLQNIRNWLQEHHSDWYNKDHEYSCLFEKRFDLPSQRRSFVEEEVAGKLPSLGYAYLMRLIENGYFNTVFTTNFDDLLNEAFHLFGNRRFGSGDDCMSDIMRPIVCAHDSSIRSISITSSRPKIVKLHGDYLFDDIKSTLRETESLEDNIRDKFVEFCKEFGLIVVGYSGNDRSIMDVLNYLLKSDDYLKNGIYWCIRKSDVISDELKKLLWKDRVYFVYIDGFDEVFADLYDRLVPGDELPVSTGSFGLNNQVLERLASNSFLKESNSPIIKRDIQKLINENKRSSLINEIKNVILEDEKGRNGARSLTADQTVKLMEVDRCLEREMFDRALELISSHLAGASDISYEYKYRLLRLKAIALDKMGRQVDALNACDMLIALSKEDVYDFYLLKTRLTKDYEGKIAVLRSYIEKNPHDFRAYELISDYELKLLSDTPVHSKQLATQLLKDLNEGIRCNPAIRNDCYARKFDYLVQKKGLASADWKSEIVRIKDIASLQDPHSPQTYSLRLQLASEADLDRDSRNACREDVWKEITDLIEQKEGLFKKYFGILLDIIDCDTNKYQERCGYIGKMIDANQWRYHTSYSFLRDAVSFYLYRKKDIRRAFSFLKLISEDDFERSDVFALLTIELLCCDDGELRKEATELYLKVKKTFNPRTQENFERERFERLGKYDKALDLLIAQKPNARYKWENFTAEMHAKLWLGRFSEVYDEFQALFRDGCDFSDREADVINYQIARVKLEHKPQKDKLEPLIKDGSDKESKAAALVLLGRCDEACGVLQNAINCNLDRALSCKSYYIFQKMGNDSIRRIIDRACEIHR